MKKHKYVKRTKHLPCKCLSCPVNLCSLLQIAATPLAIVQSCWGWQIAIYNQEISKLIPRCTPFLLPNLTARENVQDDPSKTTTDDMDSPIYVDDIYSTNPRTHHGNSHKVYLSIKSLKIQGKETMKTGKLGGFVKKEQWVIDTYWISIKCHTTNIVKCSHLLVLNSNSEKSIIYTVSFHRGNSLVS